MITTASNHLSNKLNGQFSSISWSAVFTGILLMLVVSLAMNVLGTAIGATTITQNSQLQVLGIGAGIWLIVTTVVSTAVGAYFSGFCAPARGELHGILAWAVAMLTTVYILSMLISGTWSTTLGALGRGLSLTGATVVKAAPNLIPQENDIKLSGNDLKHWLEHTFQKMSGTQNDATNSLASAASKKEMGGELIQWFIHVIQKAKPELAGSDKAALVDIITTYTDQSRSKAEQIANDYEQAYNQAFAKYGQAKQKIAQQMHQAATTASKGVAQLAWWTFIMLVLGAAAAGIAGYFGYRQQQQP